MLLCVRDQRLTATDTPQQALAAGTKRAVDRATGTMAEEGLQSLGDLIPPPPMFALESPIASFGSTTSGLRRIGLPILRARRAAASSTSTPCSRETGCTAMR